MDRLLEAAKREAQEATRQLECGMITDIFSYGVESYHANGDTSAALLYTISAEDNRGQATDLNADGEPITTIDDLEDFVRCMYGERCYSRDIERLLLVQANDLRS